MFEYHNAQVPWIRLDIPGGLICFSDCIYNEGEDGCSSRDSDALCDFLTRNVLSFEETGDRPPCPAYRRIGKTI